MEENIKILEEMKKDIVYDSDEDYDNQVAIRQIQAIENLIKAYRELEECKITRERVNDIQEETKRIVNKNYIPKSKVKEKIEELEKKEAYHKFSRQGYELAMTQYQINILKELLEG